MLSPVIWTTLSKDSDSTWDVPLAEKLVSAALKSTIECLPICYTLTIVAVTHTTRRQHPCFYTIKVKLSSNL